MNTKQYRIDLDNQKTFILNTCPIDELTEGFIRDVVIAYRLRHINLLKALEHFSKKDIEQVLEAMANLNHTIEEFIKEED
jgi:hypothetical protein